MKIQLDTEQKTIKLENDILLSKLIDTLNKLLPNKEWKKYTLQTNTIINNWNHPVYIDRWYPRREWTQPWITWCNSNMLSNKNLDTATSLRADTNYQVKSGVFNLDIQV